MFITVIASSSPNSSFTDSPAESRSNDHVFVKLWPDLKRKLSPKNIVDFLYASKIISDQEKEEISVTRNGFDKNEIILGIVKRKGRRCLVRFLQILCLKVEERHVAELIWRGMFDQGRASEIEYIREYVQLNIDRYRELDSLMKANEKDVQSTPSPNS